jgi:hypothetical protein
VTGAAGSPCAVLYELAVMGLPLDLSGFDIADFRAQACVYADVGTPAERLALPETVIAILENGTTQAVPVKWHQRRWARKKRTFAPALQKLARVRELDSDGKAAGRPATDCRCDR